MTKKELIERLQNLHTDVSKAEIGRLLNDLASVVIAHVAHGGTAEIPGLVRIGSKVRAARTGRNPASGEEIEIPAKTVPALKALKPLRNAAEGYFRK